MSPHGCFTLSTPFSFRESLLRIQHRAGPGPLSACLLLGGGGGGSGDIINPAGVQGLCWVGRTGSTCHIKALEQGLCGSGFDRGQSGQHGDVAVSGRPQKPAAHGDFVGKSL